MFPTRKKKKEQRLDFSSLLAIKLSLTPALDMKFYVCTQITQICYIQCIIIKFYLQKQNLGKGRKDTSKNDATMLTPCLSTECTSENPMNILYPIQNNNKSYFLKSHF